MNTFPAFDSIRQSSDTILLAGAGGGYDIFAGIPLLMLFKSMGKEVILANLSFSPVDMIEGERISSAVLEVNASTPAVSSYFPEKFLCQWLDNYNGEQNSIFCFERTGAKPIAEAYETLVSEYDIDTVVLVDGGTDSLMRGDEFGLGTPQEDIASIAAVEALEIDHRYLFCIGFGVDTFHGINHFQFLEAVADLTAKGAFLGAGPLLKESEEAILYKQATEFVFAQMSHHPSIVNSSILASVDGEYGDFHATHRTEGNKTWINPLMSFYWAFDLQAVADRCLYLDQIRETVSYNQLSMEIEKFRHHLDKIREWDEIPA